MGRDRTLGEVEGSMGELEEEVRSHLRRGHREEVEFAGRSASPDVSEIKLPEIYFPLSEPPRGIPMGSKDAPGFPKYSMNPGEAFRLL